MKMTTVAVLFVFALFTCAIWNSGHGARQVLLTCGGDDEGEKGDPGPPGRRGPTGLQGENGFKGEKGEKGVCEDYDAAIATLQKKVNGLEEQMTQVLQRAVRISGRKNCKDVMNEGKRTSGLYNVSIANEIVEVYCDLVTNSGGWLVIQRRMDGSVDFYRNWTEYQHGFGNKSGEYWLGLDNIFHITNSRLYELRIELEDFESQKRYAKYSTFSIGPEDRLYRLNIGGYSGNAGHDAMNHHNNWPFSTKDNDHSQNGNCAIGAHGGWWYVSCFDSNLNGQYLTGQTSTIRATAWGGPFRGHTYSMKRVEMKIRPR
ncbi:ficolin-2-like [Clavelina lepadiformis]|uniref:ficolin-2-like n=1 Tax=Clavelina lepadiformis TaxID=159417 RepID=UPI00404298C3